MRKVSPYAVLVCMFAQVSGLIPGELVHVIAGAHICGRHASIIEKLLTHTPTDVPRFTVASAVADFWLSPGTAVEGRTPRPLNTKSLLLSEVTDHERHRCRGPKLGYRM